jgi:hypothetical protein
MWNRRAQPRSWNSVSATGANKIWLMQGFTRSDQSNIPKFGDTQWQVQR